MLPVVLVLAERQREKAERLVKYCDQLDGTKIEVVEYGTERTDNQYIAAHLSFRKACKLFRKTAFFWIETDAIPRSQGWLRKIHVEHVNRRKLFTLPSLEGLSRFDHASGIGIYPRDAQSIIPEPKPSPPYFAWDHWLYARRKKFIHFTRLIQHSYGVYAAHSRRALVRRHSFPQDAEMLRADALMFHSDPTQSLIPI